MSKSSRQKMSRLHVRSCNINVFMLYFQRQCMSYHRQRSLFDLASRNLSSNLHQPRWHSHARPKRSHSGPNSNTRRKTNPWIAIPTTAVVITGLGFYAYHNSKPFKHSVLAVVRCSRVGGALYSNCNVLPLTRCSSFRCIRSYRLQVDLLKDLPF